jgi:ribose 5-phosphate isomerase B
MHQPPLRIVLGGDDAGFDYKAELIATLSRDPRVVAVMDVGPFSRTDTTAYPHYAVAAARKVRIHPSTLCLPPPCDGIR